METRTPTCRSEVLALPAFDTVISGGPKSIHLQLRTRSTCPAVQLVFLAQLVRNL